MNIRQLIKLPIRQFSTDVKPACDQCRQAKWKHIADFGQSAMGYGTAVVFMWFFLGKKD
jgi:hypothetical protein